jgi:hypothetical protein
LKKKKKFDETNIFLAHSENFKSAKKPYFTLFFATLGQRNPKIVGKFIKNQQIHSGILEKIALWANFSKSVL